MAIHIKQENLIAVLLYFLGYKGYCDPHQPFKDLLDLFNKMEEEKIDGHIIPWDIIKAPQQGMGRSRTCSIYYDDNKIILSITATSVDIYMISSLHVERYDARISISQSKKIYITIPNRWFYSLIKGEATSKELFDWIREYILPLIGEQTFIQALNHCAQICYIDYCIQTLNESYKQFEAQTDLPLKEDLLKEIRNRLNFYQSLRPGGQVHMFI
ncbi:hypothetical protein KKG22_02790 [Patescibacteria group bacterium]|nr:hypothetical protein [Patescibacteria group bacterium]MBU1721709.1 hypothetical protein [Patescibacteria group bacterium]MBU1900836.1 hypothetical protein [Patescibacteria group bacterium]